LLVTKDVDGTGRRWHNLKRLLKSRGLRAAGSSKGELQQTLMNYIDKSWQDPLDLLEHEKKAAADAPPAVSKIAPDTADASNRKRSASDITTDETEEAGNKKVASSAVSDPATPCTLC
jgi:hypothetical protein